MVGAGAGVEALLCDLNIAAEFLYPTVAPCCWEVSADRASGGGLGAVGERGELKLTCVMRVCE